MERIIKWILVNPSWPGPFWIFRDLGGIHPPPSKIAKNHAKDKKIGKLWKTIKIGVIAWKIPKKIDFSDFITILPRFCPDFPKIPINFQNSITFEPHIIKYVWSLKLKLKQCSLCINNHLYNNLCRFSLIHLRNRHKNGIIGEIGKNGGKREKSANFAFFFKLTNLH